MAREREVAAAQLRTELRSTVSELANRVESLEVATLPAPVSPHVAQRSHRSDAHLRRVQPARSLSVESRRSISPSSVDNIKVSTDFGRPETVGSDVMTATSRTALVDSTVSAIEVTPVYDREREHSMLNRSSPGTQRRCGGSSLASPSGGRPKFNTRTTVGSSLPRPTSMERTEKRVAASVEAVVGKLGVSQPSARIQTRQGKCKAVALSNSASEHHASTWMLNSAPGLATPLCCSFRRSGASVQTLSSPAKEAPRSPAVVSIMPSPMHVSRSPSGERLTAWVNSQTSGMHPTRDPTPTPVHACRARQTRSGVCATVRAHRSTPLA